jgi:cell division septal protein FtsQ
VSLSIDRPWTVVIDVQERFPFAVAADGDRWAVLDDSGALIRQVDKRPKGLPLVVDGGDRGAVFAALRAMDEPLRQKMAAGKQSETGTVEFKLRGGSVVEWGTEADSAAKAEVLSSLLPLRADRYSVATPQRPALSGDVDLPKRNVPTGDSAQ